MVKRRSKKEIAVEAIQQFIKFQESGITTPDFVKLVDVLALQDIGVHIETNHNWENRFTWFKKGECTPDQKDIVLPKKIYDGVKKGKAEALEVFFHELGHVILGNYIFNLQNSCQNKP